MVLNELVSRLQSANFSVSAGDTPTVAAARIQPQGEMTDLEQLRLLPVYPWRALG